MQRYVTLKEGIESAPEIEAWLDAVNDELRKEMDCRMRSFALYGTTHPELLMPPIPLRQYLTGEPHD